MPAKPWQNPQSPASKSSPYGGSRANDGKTKPWETQTTQVSGEPQTSAAERPWVGATQLAGSPSNAVTQNNSPYGTQNASYSGYPNSYSTPTYGRPQGSYGMQGSYGGGSYGAGSYGAGSYGGGYGSGFYGNGNYGSSYYGQSPYGTSPYGYSGMYGSGPYGGSPYNRGSGMYGSPMGMYSSYGDYGGGYGMGYPGSAPTPGNEPQGGLSRNQVKQGMAMKRSKPWFQQVDLKHLLPPKTWKACGKIPS